MGRIANTRAFASRYGPHGLGVGRPGAVCQLRRAGGATPDGGPGVKSPLALTTNSTACQLHAAGNTKLSLALIGSAAEPGAPAIAKIPKGKRCAETFQHT